MRLYQEFLDGKTTDYIKRIFEKEGVRNWDGGTKWQATTLMSMLENEKYKGDALLQKKLYGGLPYQEADAEQRGNPDVLCGG